MKKSYSEDNNAVYLEVLEVFRDDFGITDTIKVYGKEGTADCSVNVFSRFPLEQEIYFAFGAEYEPFNNPDSLQDDFYENRLLSCATITLRVIDGSIVRGPISEPPLIEGFHGTYEYPLVGFRENLSDCSYSFDEIKEVNCGNSEFQVYPNPYTGGPIKIGTDFWTYEFDQIEVYSYTGQLIERVNDVDNYEDHLQETFSRLASGVYLLVIACGERKVIRKVVL